MKRDIFQTVTTMVIWAILSAPLYLPDNITGYKPSVNTMLPLFNIWGMTTICIMIGATWTYTMQLMGKLYDYLRK